MSSPLVSAGSAVAGLPGLVLADRLAGAVPRELLAPGVLLLAGARPGRPTPVDDHLGLWGPQPHRSLEELIGDAEASGILGAGGAGFPLWRKLASLAGTRVSHVIVNGAEGETASGKDGVLLGHVPHLVLDGAAAAARALGCDRIVVRISADRADLARSLPLEGAGRRHGVSVELSIGPASFVAGEASAVIRSVAGGPSLPADLGRPPSLPGRWRRSHVLLSNVETFARLAVASRGVRRGSALASASGAVARPGVAELDADQTLADLAAVAGGTVGSPTTLVTGGWHGRWVRWDDLTARAVLTRAGVAEVDGRWGAGAFVWLPDDVRPLAALAAVADELAAGTAGQCGPCWRGLPELATLIRDAARGAGDRAAIEALMAQVDRRGICAHPTAAVAALRSGLDLLGELR